MMFFKLWKNWVNLFKRSLKTLFFCEKNLFCWLDQIFGRKILTKKKGFWKKISFMKNEISVEINVDRRILQHKENFTILTLIMSEIRWSYSPMKRKEISSNTCQSSFYNSMIGRLFFNNEFDNLDQQPTWKSTATDNQCFYALTTEIRRVTLNYAHSYAQFSHRIVTARNCDAAV